MRLLSLAGIAALLLAGAPALSAEHKCFVREYSDLNDMDLNNESVEEICSELALAAEDVYRKEDTLREWGINYWKYRDIEKGANDEIKRQTLARNKALIDERALDASDLEINEPDSDLAVEESNWIDEYAAPEYHSKARQKAAGTSYNQDYCPPGTSMVTVDERWNFLFIRGGKKRKIGCMTSQQLFLYNSQIRQQNHQRRMQGLQNLGDQMRRQSQPTQQTAPVFCRGSAVSVYGVTSGSATCF